MAAILFRMSRRNALRHNAQPHPPHRQPRQSAQGRRRERRTVVRTDGLRKSILAEDRLKDRPHPLGIGLLYRLGAQKITAPRIADGQRIDPRSVAAAKPALEIGAPHSVRIHGMLQRFCVWLGPVPLPPRHHQAGSLDHLADRAHRRPRPLWLVALQHSLQFARSPRPTLPR